MSRVDPSLAASVRAYLARDWGAFERVRDHERRDHRATVDAATWQHMDQLRASAQALHARWPTEADREADLEDHRRLAATLARTASRPRSPRAVRGR